MRWFRLFLIMMVFWSSVGQADPAALSEAVDSGVSGAAPLAVVNQTDMSCFQDQKSSVIKFIESLLRDTSPVSTSEKSEANFSSGAR